jgi:16S rRNA (guanine527-N7)-methyltransferase
MRSEMSLETMLKEGAGYFSVKLEDSHVLKLLKYKELLMEWNQKMNLTAIEEDKEVIIKHFIDSFSIIPYLKNAGEKIIDVGTGAGFPGIPVKIVCNAVDILLLDSLAKRVNFLNLIIDQLSLEKVKAVHGRAEDIGVNPIYREKYDISVARAVANLPVLLEYCLPFVKVGGIFIAMKGSVLDEMEGSDKALGILGGKIEEVKEFNLPFSDIKRNIVIIRKLRQTPTKYPRKAGKPSKEPLI